MKPPALHWSAIAILEAFGRQSGIGARRYLEIALQGAEPTDEEDRALRGGFFPLGDSFSTARADNGTLGTMTATEIEPARRGRPSAHPKHPFVEAMRREGLTIAEVAADMKCSVSAVKSWYKHPKDLSGRPIPKDRAAYLRQRFGVPLSAWKRIGS